ncbi:hypothetical protein [Spirosoma oryzicola]|uniref:hypothetical protein n=1 Tax=Spirosoma oryzicola TaxID=2898794 RepID=UPI001E2D7E17|nr:hypothetical protein [Spirosoma oryzicola]UHG93228.1 hypothetical protein LQ777_10085 [Spirosoma oryzicola]
MPEINDAMQTSNPFEKTVGLKGVQPESVNFPVWINDLPGMSTELVSAVADSEDESDDDPSGIKATWARVCRLGLETLSTMLEGELSKSADFSYIGTRTGNLTGEASDVVLLPAAQWKGYIVNAQVSKDDELFVKCLTVACANEEDTTTRIRVFDPKGKALFEKDDVVVKPDINVLDIGYIARSPFGRSIHLFVAIDATELSLNVLGDGQEWDCTDFNFYLDSVKSPTNLINSIGNVDAADTTSILLEAYVRRSLIDQIAKYEDRFRWAYAYVVGSLLMTDKLASPNINLFTNTNRLFTEEHRVELMDEAKKKVCPIARDIIKALRPTPALQQPNPDDQRGYYPGSFI